MTSARTDLEGSYSSLDDYLGKRKTSWVKKELILSFFSNTNPLLSYKAFVEDNKLDTNEVIQPLIFS